ncbi:hypothetical protein [Robertkochia solimangrovi]|uniref:hypothetical protein n=1 Tax=Robertkochia solimangrovi TaxID=2213046 RepID=UPI0011800469|nr:hypothetical protein [Robertkochia solimangrovi]TRZ42163.1 hypothetical protein DMZ48_14110 [Robertkochia solimangrovi]
MKKVNPSFTKMLVSDENIYALNSSGQLHVWNLKSLNRTFTTDTNVVKYTSIAKDNSNKIYLGTAKGKIFTIDKNDYSIDLHLELKKDYSVTDIFFNSTDEIFLIVPYAVYDPIKDKYWTDFKHQPNGMIVSKRFLFLFRKRTNKYFDMPQYAFIDSQDRIWMAKSFGEFGGSIQIFDTRRRTELSADIDSLNFGLLFPKSVFEDKDQNIYITSGLQHFMNSGDIFRIKNNTAIKIYDSEDFRKTTETNPFGGGIFVGPGTYNAFDNKIYFATTEGFYRAAIPNEGRIENPELIFKPELLWDREPLAIGVSMSVKRLTFTTDNRLVFLTSNNGIGIYDGTELKMIK